MNNPCEGCSVYNVCGHAGGKPDTNECLPRHIYNIIAARDKEWVEEMEYMRKNCGQMPICKDADCGWYIQSKNCLAWQERKKEVGLLKEVVEHRKKLIATNNAEWVKWIEKLNHKSFSANDELMHIIIPVAEWQERKKEIGL